MRKGIIAVLMMTTLLLVGCGDNKEKEQPKGQANQPAQQGAKQWSEPPKMVIDQKKQYHAVMETSLGTLRIELFAKDAPMTVNNFVFLAREGFYEGTKFHRIIKGFMVQGGDPTGTGRGGPGYKFADELPPKRPYSPGIVAMANAGPNTNGSQFFICTGENCSNLNNHPNYTQFGVVVDGMDVLAKLESVEVTRGGESVPSLPKNPPVIKKIRIEER